MVYHNQKTRGIIMVLGKKQYLTIFVILIAVVGIIGAGCLNKDKGNSNNVSAPNGTNNTTNNSNNTTTNTSNNTSKTNATSNTSAPNTSYTPPSSSSSLPDVVVASHDGGSGGGRGRTTSPVSPATFNGTPVPYNENETEDPNVKVMYFYVPASELAGQSMTISMSGTISEFEILTADLIDADTAKTNSSGKTMTVTFAEGAADKMTAWDNFDLNVTVGSTVYQVSFYASGSWNATSSAGGSLSVVEIAEGGDTRDYTPAVIDAGKTKTFVSETLRINFTLTPNDGYVGTINVLDSNNDPVELTQTGLNTYETTAAITSQKYTVTAFFEKAAAGAYESGLPIFIEQELNSQVDGNTIYLYVPAAELAEKTLILTMGSPVKSAPVISDSTIVNSAVNDGSKITITLGSDLSAMQAGGTTTDPTPTFTVETNTSVYNVSILNSAAIQIIAPAGCTITSTGGLSITGTTENHVFDIGFDDTFTTDSGTLTLTKSGVAVDDFAGAITYESAFYVLTVTA